jgi:hypothetical protein
MHCTVKESWKHLNKNGFQGENLGIPREVDHLIADMFHIGFVKAAFPSAAAKCIAVIAHLVDDLIEHIEFVSNSKQFEPKMVIFYTKKPIVNRVAANGFEGFGAGHAGGVADW